MRKDLPAPATPTPDAQDRPSAAADERRRRRAARRRRRRDTAAISAFVHDLRASGPPARA